LRIVRVLAFKAVWQFLRIFGLVRLSVCAVLLSRFSLS